MVWCGGTCSETHGVSCTCKETCSPSKLIFLEYKAPRNVEQKSPCKTKLYAFSAILISASLISDENHAESLKTRVQITEMIVTSKMGWIKCYKDFKKNHSSV